MTFSFDPAAALAEIRNQTDDPAKVAKVAKLEGRQGQTLAGFAALAGPDPDAFEERAAILEHDAGMTRPEAERLAAQAQGFASAAEFRRFAAGLALVRADFAALNDPQDPRAWR